MDTGLKTDYSLSEIDMKKIDEFKKTLPKYKRIKYLEYICFSHNSGIGMNVEFRREYNNGKTFYLDITDYSKW